MDLYTWCPLLAYRTFHIQIRDTLYTALGIICLSALVGDPISDCSVFLGLLSSFRSWPETKMNMTVFSHTHNSTHRAATTSSAGRIPSHLLHHEDPLWAMDRNCSVMLLRTMYYFDGLFMFSFSYFPVFLTVLVSLYTWLHVLCFKKKKYTTICNYV